MIVLNVGSLHADGVGSVLSAVTFLSAGQAVQSFFWVGSSEAAFDVIKIHNTPFSRGIRI